jgi:hypothetical protein
VASSLLGFLGISQEIPFKMILTNKLRPSLLRLGFYLLFCALPCVSSFAVGNNEDVVGNAGVEGNARPLFLIETIEVEGNRRVTPEIVLSEALLTEGMEYSEAELLDAVHRLVRLPFILEARFSLERGSERGKLKLVITVEEVRRYFFGSDWRYNSFGRNLNLEEFSAARGDNFQLFALAGMRFFPGRESVAFVSSANGGVQAGYTRYGLGPRRMFLSLGYQRQFCCIVRVQPLGIDPAFSSWTTGIGSDRGTLTLGVPLNRQRALRFDLSFENSERGTRRPLFEAGDSSVFFPYDELRELRFEASWTHDTTDDPTFPTRGTNLSVALEVRDFEADFSEAGVLVTPFPTEPALLQAVSTTMRSRLVRAVSSGTHHWSLGKNTLSAGFRVALGQTRIRDLPTPEGFIAETEFEVWEAGINLRHLVMLYHSKWQQRHRELFWESQVSLGIEGTSSEFEFFDNPLSRLTLSTGLAYRTGWGIFRLGFSYLDLRRVV